MKKPALIAILFLIPLFSHAAEQDQILQLQKQFEQDQSRQKELQQIERERKKIEEEDRKEFFKEDLDADIDLNKCFFAEKIVILPSKILSDFRTKSLVKNHAGKCLNILQIRELNQIITNNLVGRGYTTSRAEIFLEEHEKDVLKIKIIESKLEDLLFNQEKFSDKMQKFTAFGSLPKGDILNMEKIENGLDQINRLSSNNAVMKISPGKQKNSSVVLVENTATKTSNVTLSYDNYGSRITGVKRESISFSQDNLFKLNDNISINRTANELNANHKERGSNSFSSSFSIPFTWYTLTLQYSKSSYFFHLGKNRTKNNGETSSKSASLDVNLLKKRRIKITSNFNLLQRYNQNFSGDAKQEESSRKASIASAGISTTLFFNNSSLLLKPSFSKSLNILDAEKDPVGLDKSSAHAKFNIWKFYGNYTQRFNAAKTPINYSLTFDSQISDRTLYGNDRFSVGGVYSVRGFRDGSISFDSGYSLKNEVTINLGQAFLPYLNQNEPSKYLQYLNNFYITPFYDYGFTQAAERKREGVNISTGEILRGATESGRLSGAGIKLGANHKYLNANITFARVLSRSQHLLQNYNEKSVIYFNLSANFGF
jgi:hemolysin activation/secretion protein